MSKFIQLIKEGEATKVTSLIENVLKGKVSQILSEAIPDVATDVYGSCDGLELSEKGEE